MRVHTSTITGCCGSWRDYIKGTRVSVRQGVGTPYMSEVLGKLVLLKVLSLKGPRLD